MLAGLVPLVKTSSCLSPRSVFLNSAAFRLHLSDAVFSLEVTLGLLEPSPAHAGTIGEPVRSNESSECAHIRYVEAWNKEPDGMQRARAHVDDDRRCQEAAPSKPKGLVRRPQNGGICATWPGDQDHIGGHRSRWDDQRDFFPDRPPGTSFGPDRCPDAGRD